MKTNDLIAMLARNEAAVAPRVRFPWAAVAAASVVSFIVLVLWRGLNDELVSDMALGMFWVKILFVSLLALTLAPALQKLALPGQRATTWLKRAGFVAAIAWAVLLAGSVLSERAEVMEALTDDQNSTCPITIFALSIPLMVAGFFGMRQLAPTRLTLAGACVGLFSGAVAATVYALHCTGYHPTFIAVWYTLGMLIPTVIGAALGRFVLRW
jgi:hypothetical protein